MTGRAVRIAAAAAVVLVLALILAPLCVFLLTGFLSQPLGPGAQLTLGNYQSLVTDPSWWPLVESSAIFTIGASAVAMVLAVSFAWLVTSVDIPGRAVLRFLPMAVLFPSALLRDTAWIELFSPNSGLVNLAVRHFGLPSFDIYTMAGMIIVAGLSLMPIPYLILLAPFGNLDRSLSEASEMSGAGRLETLRKVVLPVLRPALLSALALTLIIVASAFEEPVLIGKPGGIQTYMSAIYGSMTQALPNFNYAAAQASLYAALTVLLLIWYLRATRKERRFTSVSGRGHQQKVIHTRWRYLAAAPIVLYFVIAFVMPVLTSLLVSLLPYYTVTEGNPLHLLTLDNYRGIFGDPLTRSAFVTSLAIACLAVVGTTVVGLGLSYISLKTRFRGRRVAEIVGTAPIGIPSVVFSVALLTTFVTVPGVSALYNTYVPLLAAEMIVFLPFSIRIFSSALIQLPDDLLEASRVTGAGSLQTFNKVVLPLLRPALLYAGAVVFVLSFRELGSVVLLVTPGTNLISTAIFSYWSEARFGVVAAVNMVAMIGPMIVVAVAFLLFTPRRRSRVHLPTPAATVLQAVPVSK
jgi:iron(III) transport system permease protein